MYMRTLTIILAVFLLQIRGFAQTNAEQKLAAAGLKLPQTSKPLANYVKWVKTGNLVFTAGHGSELKGVLGKTLTTEQGYDAARQTGLQLLATLKDAIGDLEKVKRIVKITGFVMCADDFTDQPKVINGISDLMVLVFGENGKHARTAVGTNALPNGIALEIEMVVELRD